MITYRLQGVELEVIFIFDFMLFCIFQMNTFRFYNHKIWDFPGGAVVKNLPANAGDTGWSPGPERSHMLRSNQARAPQLTECTLQPASHNY